MKLNLLLIFIGISFLSSAQTIMHKSGAPAKISSKHSIEFIGETEKYLIYHSNKNPFNQNNMDYSNGSEIIKISKETLQEVERMELKSAGMFNEIVRVFITDEKLFIFINSYTFQFNNSIAKTKVKVEYWDLNQKLQDPISKELVVIEGPIAPKVFLLKEENVFEIKHESKNHYFDFTLNEKQLEPEAKLEDTDESQLKFSKEFHHKINFKSYFSFRSVFDNSEPVIGSEESYFYPMKYKNAIKDNHAIFIKSKHSKDTCFYNSEGHYKSLELLEYNLSSGEIRNEADIELKDNEFIVDYYICETKAGSIAVVGLYQIGKSSKNPSELGIFTRLYTPQLKPIGGIEYLPLKNSSKTPDEEQLSIIENIFNKYRYFHDENTIESHNKFCIFFTNLTSDYQNSISIITIDKKSGKPQISGKTFDFYSNEEYAKNAYLDILNDSTFIIIYTKLNSNKDNKNGDIYYSIFNPETGYSQQKSIYSFNDGFFLELKRIHCDNDNNNKGLKELYCPSFDEKRKNYKIHYFKIEP